MLRKSRTCKAEKIWFSGEMALLCNQRQTDRRDREQNSAFDNTPRNLTRIKLVRIAILCFLAYLRDRLERMDRELVLKWKRPSSRSRSRSCPTWRTTRSPCRCTHSTGKLRNSKTQRSRQSTSEAPRTSRTPGDSQCTQRTIRSATIGGRQK